MSTFPPPTKKIRRCFFLSLAFVIVIPITCIVLGVTVRPKEFKYNAREPASNDGIRKVDFHVVVAYYWTHRERLTFARF